MPGNEIIYNYAGSLLSDRALALSERSRELPTTYVGRDRFRYIPTG